HSSYIQRAIMDDRSSTQSFSNLHHHRHRPPFHLTLPSLQSPELGYPSSQSALDTLEQYGSRGEESTTSFSTSSTSSVGRRASSGGDRGLLNASGLDGDANLGGHLDGESGMSSHFSDTWYGSSKKEEVWEDGESCESTADDFYSKGDCYNHTNDVFYTANCGNEEGVRRKVRANYNNYAHVSYEAKSETVYNREANVSHFTKQPTSFNRSTAGSFSDNSVDYCRTDSRVKTKTACQCVEFFYLSKRIQDKQKKQKEEEESKLGEMEQQKSITPTCQPVNRQFGLEEAVPVPSLASFFPCKLCGKMFYKIKSRNAHMKIHRQPQEDWTDRRLQHQLLAQRLALSRTTNIIPTVGATLLPPQAPSRSFSSSGLPATASNNSNADSVLNSVTSSNALAPSSTSVLDPSTVVAYSNIAVSNSHVITNIDGGDSNQREATTVLPFHQSWGSFGHGPDPVTFYCTTEGKDDVAAGAVGAKESINWP
ncbi:hypothetical protein GBF38_005453, partial [Nibea albiflora]